MKKTKRYLVVSKKNAFTLIELLAIIVILAIIAVITVPIILNIIENSKKGAATDSAYGYKDAINKWYVQRLSSDQDFNLSNGYTVEDGKIIDDSVSNDQGTLVPFLGDKPSSGELHYSDNVLTSGCLVFGDYQVIFESDGSVETSKGDCSEYQYDDLVFTSFTGVKAGGVYGSNNWYNDYCFIDSEELPDNPSYWVQTNGTVAQACINNGSSKYICYSINSFDCDEIVNEGGIVSCSNSNSTLGKKLDELQNQTNGFSCSVTDYGGGSSTISCYSGTLGLKFLSSGIVEADDTAGANCEALSDATISCTYY